MRNNLNIIYLVFSQKHLTRSNDDNLEILCNNAHLQNYILYIRITISIYMRQTDIYVLALVTTWAPTSAATFNNNITWYNWHTNLVFCWYCSQFTWCFHAGQYHKIQIVQNLTFDSYTRYIVWLCVVMFQWEQ